MVFINLGPTISVIYTRRTPIKTALLPFCKRVSTSSMTAHIPASISSGKLSFGGKSPSGGSYTTTE